MGRKIPGRKHRGVRDPEKQRAKRLESIKDKINAPPADPDAQHIPKSALRVAELQAKTKQNLFKRKKKKVVPKKFQQKDGETDRQFMHRISLVCEEVKKEARFESKYNVEIKRNEFGEVQGIEKRAKDPIKVMLKEAKKTKKPGAKVEERLTKSQKKRQKILEKKRLKNEPFKDFDNLKDSVKFGEQIHGPPVLTAPKKSANIPSAANKSLLLTSILNPQAKKEEPDKKVQKIDKKGKRKDLPYATRRQLDKQQQEVIQAYKDLKAARNKK